MSGTTLISVQVLRERKQTEGKHDFQPKAPLCVGGLGAQLYTGLFASGTAYEQAVLQMEYKYKYSAPNIFRSFVASNQPPKGN